MNRNYQRITIWLEPKQLKWLKTTKTYDGTKISASDMVRRLIDGCQAQKKV